MARVLKVLMVVWVAGLFFVEAPSAHAIFGIRAARTAIAARRAKQSLAQDPEPAASATENSAEKLKRLEAESKDE